MSQRWPNGEVATFASDISVDILGQQRGYTFTSPTSNDGRGHVATKQLLDVPVLALATNALPDAVGANESPSSQTLTTS